jgi:hypothetical protein
VFSGLAAAGFLLAQPCAGASPTEPVDAAEIRRVLEQNRRLQDQVEAQQRQIDELRARLDRLGSEPAAPRAAVSAWERSPGQIRLSAEAGLAFFSSGDNGAYPNSEFRVDDARVFLEAALGHDAYFFGGLDLSTREANDEYLHVGELYVDFESVVSSGRDPVLNVRVGRFFIPFGEEYQTRDVLANPLITHSVADLWGIDEGVQVYGRRGRLSYNLAVQNGGHKTMHDFNSDKAVVARIGFAATPRLRFSASAMRTGKLDVANDGLSEIWLANAFFRSIGSAATTRTFGAELAELDAAWHWQGGRLRADAGWIEYDDDSTAADNRRRLHYFSVEATQALAGALHGAIRFSELRAPRGYPLVGQGGAGEYFYSPAAPFTRDLRRLSAGLRYEFGPPLVWKLEYSWESGHLVSGARREDTHLLSSELGVKF